MIDVSKWSKTAPQRSEDDQDKALTWRQVPVAYLIEFVDERAAIFQYEGKLTRESAERLAVQEADSRFLVYELTFC